MFPNLPKALPKDALQAGPNKDCLYECKFS